MSRFLELEKYSLYDPRREQLLSEILNDLDLDREDDQVLSLLDSVTAVDLSPLFLRKHLVEYGSSNLIDFCQIFSLRKLLCQFYKDLYSTKCMSLQEILQRLQNAIEKRDCDSIFKWHSYFHTYLLYHPIVDLGDLKMHNSILNVEKMFMHYCQEVNIVTQTKKLTAFSLSIEDLSSGSLQLADYLEHRSDFSNVFTEDGKLRINSFDRLFSCFQFGKKPILEVGMTMWKFDKDILCVFSSESIQEWKQQISLYFCDEPDDHLVLEWIDKVTKHALNLAATGESLAEIQRTLHIVEENLEDINCYIAEFNVIQSIVLKECEEMIQNGVKI